MGCINSTLRKPVQLKNHSKRDESNRKKADDNQKSLQVTSDQLYLAPPTYDESISTYQSNPHLANHTSVVHQQPNYNYQNFICNQNLNQRHSDGVNLEPSAPLEYNYSENNISERHSTLSNFISRPNQDSNQRFFAEVNLEPTAPWRQNYSENNISERHSTKNNFISNQNLNQHYSQNAQCIGTTENLKPKSEEVDLHKVVKELANFSGHSTNIETLSKILSVRYDDILEVIQTKNNIFMIHGSSDKVELFPKIKICEEHSIPSGCLDSNCFSLHICLDFSTDVCKDKNCPFGHFWKSNHNENVLRKFFLDELPLHVLDSLMKKILSFAFGPMICFRYNRQGCVLGDLCKDLHICYSYAKTLGNCENGENCPYNHDIRTPSCLALFDKFGISTNDSPRDILKALAMKSKNKNGYQPSNRLVKKSKLVKDNCASSGTALEFTDNRKENFSSKSTKTEERKNPKTRTFYKSKSMQNLDDLKTEVEDSNALSDAKIETVRSQNDITMVKTSKQVKTVYSWELHGTVRIPLICFMGIENRCRYARSANGCHFLHSREPYQWQFGHEEVWYNFHPKQSLILEKKFRDPACEKVFLPKLARSLVNKELTGILSLLGTERIIVDFLKNTALLEDSKRVYSVRHLTTASSAVSNMKYSTKFIWYFKNDATWDTLGSRRCPTETVENAYLDNPSGTFLYHSSKFAFQLDFKKMTRRSVSSGIEVAIRRRPAPF